LNILINSFLATFSLPKQGTLTGPAIGSKKPKEGQESAFRKNLTNIDKSKTILANNDKQKPKDPIMTSIIQKVKLEIFCSHSNPLF